MLLPDPELANDAEHLMRGDLEGYIIDEPNRPRRGRRLDHEIADREDWCSLDLACIRP